MFVCICISPEKKDVRFSRDISVPLRKPRLKAIDDKATTMPTERTRQQQHAKDPSPPDEGYYGRDGQDPSDPSGAVRGAERSGSSGIKAKLAAKWNRRRTDDSEKKVRILVHFN